MTDTIEDSGTSAEKGNPEADSPTKPILNGCEQIEEPGHGLANGSGDHNVACENGVGKGLPGQGGEEVTQTRDQVAGDSLCVSSTLQNVDTNNVPSDKNSGDVKETSEQECDQFTSSDSFSQMTSSESYHDVTDGDEVSQCSIGSSNLNSNASDMASFKSDIGSSDKPSKNGHWTESSGSWVESSGEFVEDIPHSQVNCKAPDSNNSIEQSQDKSTSGIDLIENKVCNNENGDMVPDSKNDNETEKSMETTQPAETDLKQDLKTNQNSALTSSDSVVINNEDSHVGDKLSQSAKTDSLGVTSSDNNLQNNSPEHLSPPSKSSSDISDESDMKSSDDQLLSELDAELDSGADTPTGSISSSDIQSQGNDEQSAQIPPINGMNKNLTCENHPQIKEKLQKQVSEYQQEISRLKEENEEKTSQLSFAAEEKNLLQKKIQHYESKSADEAYTIQIKELEARNAALQQELKLNQDKLLSHDAAAKRAVASLQSEIKSKIELAHKKFEDCKSEKDSMVIKYAQAEKKNIELQGRMERMEAKMKEFSKERDIVIGKFRAMKAEKQKITEIFESRAAEMVGLKRQLEYHKEAVNSHEIKTKWAQNKLKAETDAHAETKRALEEAQRKIATAKEETEMIRKDCQAMIRTYQESEEIRSNNLDHQLKEKEVELITQKQEKTDREEVYVMVQKELETLKLKHKEMLAELTTYKDKVKCLDSERINQEEHLNKYRETLQSQKKDNKDLHERLQELENVNEELDEEKEKVKKLRAEVDGYKQKHSDFESDMNTASKAQAENLEFTQKISDKNAKLQSENASLNLKVTGLSAELERLTSVTEELQVSSKKLESELKEEKRLRQEETELLSTQLSAKTKCVEELTINVEEEKDENRILKRKHGANIKDLTRQLQQCKKRLETYENKGDKDSTSMGSRTSSNGSLDTLGSGQNSLKSHIEPVPQEEEYPLVKIVEVDKQMLMEKIVKLQKAHARKNEKLEFMEDHINQLILEVKRKTKIIQSYALREEAGTLAPERADQVKAQMQNKGGIMASVYSSQPRDGAMTLDLSLDINKKLQQVLEDTLLKNITLKENLDTLGQEIARLSQENRQIQLKLQESKS